MPVGNTVSMVSSYNQGSHNSPPRISFRIKICIYRDSELAVERAYQKAYTIKLVGTIVSMVSSPIQLVILYLQGF